MRESIVESITGTIKDLNKSGLVDDITMRNIETLCLPEIQDYSPEKIVNIWPASDFTEFFVAKAAPTVPQ